jgi:outer membrane protein assembly factor BamE
MLFKYQFINMKKLAVLCFSLIFLAACSRSFDGGYNVPLLYKVDIQQGNVIEQDMINKLRPGMDKNQVKFIMGTPVIVDPFHNDRWEYIFSFQEGGGIREQRHITLHFNDDEILTHVSGDIEVSYVPRVENEIVTEDEAIIVPEGSYKKEEKGFFGRIWDKVTPGED